MTRINNAGTKFEDQAKAYAESGQHADLNDFCDNIKGQKKMRKMKAICDFPISYEVSEDLGVLWGVLRVGFGVQQNTLPLCVYTDDVLRTFFYCQFLFVLKRTQERGPAVLRHCLMAVHLV